MVRRIVTADDKAALAEFTAYFLFIPSGGNRGSHI